MPSNSSYAAIAMADNGALGRSIPSGSPMDAADERMVITAKADNDCMSTEAWVGLSSHSAGTAPLKSFCLNGCSGSNDEQENVDKEAGSVWTISGAIVPV